jgi:exodeoxyribonuclease VII small subunit
MKKNKADDSYEQIFVELESIVEKMDSGDISLEKSLELFEKGMGLLKDGKKKLDQAESKVKTLIKDSDSYISKKKKK